MPVSLQAASGNLQGSSYNPQPQPKKKKLQGSVITLQKTAPPSILNNPKTKIVVPTAAQVRAASQAIKIVLAKKQAAEKTKKAQNSLNLKVKTAQNKTRVIVNNAAWKGKINIAPTPFKQPKIILPKQTPYQKAYADAYNKALEDYEKQKQPGKKSFLQKAWDKVSFGQDRRDSGAREYAAKKANEIALKSVEDYEAKLNKFLKTQARQKSKIESTKFKSQHEFNQAKKKYDLWQHQNIGDLENQRATITASIEAYGKASQKPLTSASADVASWVNRNVIHGVPGKALGGVWKYTLGSGSKNVPSIVTAPSRAVNWVGNLNTKNRQIYKTGGGSFDRTGSGLNAWQATHNQRNLNIKPVVVPDFTVAEAERRFGYKVRQLQRAGGYKGISHEQGLRRMWGAAFKQSRFQNSAKEVIADPLNIAVGGGWVARSLGLSGKVAKTAKASKWYSAASSVKKAVADTKAVKWLTAEYKSPQEKLADAIKVAKTAQGRKQDVILARVNQINKKLTGNQKLDVSIFDDFKNLTDSEAAMLQRMTAGKLTGRDRLMLAGKNYAPIRAKLEQIAGKWDDFTEKMRLADDVRGTRFGKGKTTYSPRTAWIRHKGHTLDDYDFRLKKKNLTPQTAADFRQGAIDRYFKSSVDDKWITSQGDKKRRLMAEKDILLKQYDDAVEPARAGVEKAFNKLPWYLKRPKEDKLAKVVRFAAGNTPTKLWKKSVLKYRPAWTVNNVLYNTQASVLAGGPRALAEQARLLNPRKWRQALDEIPESVKTNIAKEVGKSDKLTRFYGNVENLPRVGAFRALKAKGYSDAEALKRVDRYLLNYRIRNWERPIKSAIPFWSFQKGIAKAAVHMPGDRPLAAIAYNRLDRHQQQQFDKDFASVVPRLRKLGYTDAEIGKIKDENAKYFKGRLKVGGKYWTTPFNAFSEKGLSQMGFNPYAAGAGEVAGSVDQYNQKIGGKEAGFLRRLISKFPQADLAAQWLSKPTKAKWIGKPGHEGYGLGKEKQGFDPSKPNYSPKLDPKRKFGQNLAAFAGKPREMTFDKDQLVKQKALEKATQEYFATDWQKLQDKDFDKAEAQKKTMFKKYGMSEDDFFKGFLAKYDSENTKRIKGQKEAAAKANKSLFEQYAKQPKGKRNLWATAKLRQLVRQGYFDDNPFLKSFKWIEPKTVAKANKQQIVVDALATGDWSEYRKKYGLTQKSKDYQTAKASGDWTAYTKKYGVKSEKAKAYRSAVKTGDWSAYRKKYGVKESPYKYKGKFFKSEKTMKKYIEGEFWRKYVLASADDRKAMLAKNPEFNTRADWTADQWNKWRADRKKKLVKRGRKFGNIAKLMDQNIVKNRAGAAGFIARRDRGRPKKPIWRLQT